MAADFLEKQGLTVIEKNYRCSYGEIDLIAQDGACLVFVEVKYRSNQDSGGALAAVDWKKQQRIGRTAQNYLLRRYQSMDCFCRFDVIGIDGEEICWIPDAFPCRL